MAAPLAGGRCITAFLASSNISSVSIDQEAFRAAVA
jgi:hypothetical protein